MIKRPGSQVLADDGDLVALDRHLRPNRPLTELALHFVDLGEPASRFVDRPARLLTRRRAVARKAALSAEERGLLLAHFAITAIGAQR